jgi:hypothetical protein
MSKYDPLKHHLASQSWSEVTMTFAEVEAVLGAKLPRSAYTHAAWWANESEGSHVQAKAWLDAGFETADVDKISHKLTFKRVAVAAPSENALGQGVKEDAKPYVSEPGKKSRRHPLFGCMKGTFWIDPNWDLTKPSLDEDELAEWDKSLDRKADLIDAGMRRKS